VALGILGGLLGIYALPITSEGWLTDRVGWIPRILACLSALLFFVPRISLGWLGQAWSDLIIPAWGTQVLGIAILLLILIAHRVARASGPREITA